MEQVLVIYEIDKSDDARSVIGVASSVEKAISLIKEYYGEKECFSKPKMIQESGLEFTMSVEVVGQWGGIYDITVFYFNIDCL